MSILNLNNQNVEPTLDQKKERAANRILSLSAQTYNQLLSIQKQGIDIVWNNPQGLTPQQVCDALGDKAVKVFDFHKELTEVIVSIASIDGVTPDIALPKKAFIRNQDGTITVTDDPYVG